LIVLDANVLIARWDQDDASHERAVEVIDHFEWDEFLTSSVTLAEVLDVPKELPGGEPEGPETTSSAE